MLISDCFQAQTMK